jgi:suppressor of G2 allele of SKP1
MYIPFNQKGQCTNNVLKASLQFPLPSGAEYAFTLDPLYARIDPSASKVSVMSTKIEITLQKQVAGQKWNALEASTSTPTTTLADRPAAAAPSTSSGPAYPTSSRHGAKDWDKVASSLTAKKSKDKKKKSTDEEGNGEGDVSDAESADSELGGDAVDGFFKKLYAGADPDTRRAMMKSYVESQGTSLSTNWQEVAKGKVEPHPPS